MKHYKTIRVQYPQMYQCVADFTLQTDSSLHHCRCENNSNVCKMWGSQSSVNENWNLLGYDAMQVGIVIYSLEGCSWTQSMEAANSSQTSVTTHNSTWHHVLEDFTSDLSKIILKLIRHFNSFWCNRIILLKVKFIYWHQFKKCLSYAVIIHISM